MRFARRVLVAVSVGCLIGLVGMSPAAASEATALKGKSETPDGLISAGADPAPFSLQDLDGNTHALTDHKGSSAVLLAFWSFFCGPCREEIPLLDTIGKKYADKGFEIWAINLDGPKLEKAVRKYMSSNNFTFRVLWEEIEGISFKTADSYGVVGTPTLVLIGKDGKVSWAHVGRENPDRIEAEIQKALGLGS